MILLDTKVVSEAMRPIPSATVLEWLNRQHRNSLFLSVITLGEIEFGLRILPKGKRRSDLEARFERFMDEGFSRRILDYKESRKVPQSNPLLRIRQVNLQRRGNPAYGDGDRFGRHRKRQGQTDQ